MKDFIPPNEALELKHLGFDEGIPTFYSYPENKLSYTMDGHNQVSIRRNSQFGQAVSAPTFSQAFRWFREKYGLVGIVKFGTNDFTYNIYNVDAIGLLTKESLNFNGTYEEAELACLRKLIEIVKQKQ